MSFSKGGIVRTFTNHKYFFSYIALPSWVMIHPYTSVIAPVPAPSPSPFSRQSNSSRDGKAGLARKGRQHPPRRPFSGPGPGSTLKNARQRSVQLWQSPSEQDCRLLYAGYSSCQRWPRVARCARDNSVILHILGQRYSVCMSEYDLVPLQVVLVDASLSMSLKHNDVSDTKLRVSAALD